MKLINLSKTVLPSLFDFQIRTARTKLTDRNIHWKEEYTPDTAYFHAMYEAIVGPSSYYRFVGIDADSGERYFAVIGPAKMHDPEAKFFAGTRKLPSNYAASGQYYSEIMEAIKYAIETWGLPIPHNTVMHYTSSDLKGLGPKMEEWRSTHDKQPILANFKKPMIEEEDDEVEVDNATEEKDDIEASFVGIVRLAAYEQEWTTRDPYAYWDINEHFNTFVTSREINFFPDPFPPRGRRRRVRPARNGEDYRIPEGVTLIQDQVNPFKFIRQDNNEPVDFRKLVNPAYKDDLSAINRVAFRGLSNVDQGDERWQTETAHAPWLKGSLALAKRDYRMWYLRAAEMYPEESINRDNLRYELGFGNVQGKGYRSYGWSLGPYLGFVFKKAVHKFGVFRRHLKTQSREQIMQTVMSKLNELAKQYGIDAQNIDPNDVLNIPEEISAGYYAGDPITIDSKKQKLLMESMIRQNPGDYQDLFAGAFDPEGEEWNAANKGWDKRVESRQLQLQAKFIKDIYPEQAAMIDNLIATGDPKAVALTLNTILLPLYGGNVQAKQQEPQIKTMALEVKRRAEQAVADGSYMGKFPALRIDLNLRFREGGGQLKYSTLHREPVFEILEANNDSNQVIVKQRVSTQEDLLDRDIQLIPGLAVNIVGSRMNERGTSARLPNTFIIQNLTPREDGSFVLTLNAPIKHFQNWMPTHLGFEMDDQGLPVAGVVQGVDGNGQPCMVDFSKSDRELAEELHLDIDVVRESRQAQGFLVLGYNNFLQCVKSMELGRGAAQGFHPTPVQKVCTSQFMKAAKDGTPLPELKDAPPEEGQALLPAETGEAPAGVEETPQVPAPSEVPVNPEAGVPAPAPLQTEFPEVIEPTEPTPAEAAQVINEGVQPSPPKRQPKRPARRRRQQAPQGQELLASTWNKLIRLAAELDQKGQCKEAEEIHRILRKHQHRLADFEIRLEN